MRLASSSACPRLIDTEIMENLNSSEFKSLHAFLQLFMQPASLCRQMNELGKSFLFASLNTSQFNHLLACRTAETRHVSCVGNKFFWSSKPTASADCWDFQPSQRFRSENDPRETNYPLAWTDLLWWCQGSKVRVVKQNPSVQESISEDTTSLLSISLHIRNEPVLLYAFI